MRRTVRLGLGVAVATMLMAPGYAGAQTPRPELRQVAALLDLTAAGAAGWLTALRAAPGKESAERLLAISAAGEIVATRDGGESSVSLGRELDTRLLGAGDAVLLVHNHPGNAGLSANDLVQLAKPGVAGIVAVARDGSIYLAVRGARYDLERFEEWQYDVARVEIRKRLRVECGSGTLKVAAADAQFSHLAAFALSKAGVIEYRATLVGGSRASFQAAQAAFTEVVLGAAAAIARNHR